MRRLLTGRQLLALLALGSPLTSIAAQSSSAKTRSAIEATNTRYVNAFNKGDVAAFVKVYDADAMVMAPNMAAVRGQPAITEYWQGGWKAGVRNIKLTTLEVSAHGNEATEIGNYQLDLVGADGTVAGNDHGKFVVLWKRNAKGEWKWHRDIYNSDVPAAPAAPANGSPNGH